MAPKRENSNDPLIFDDSLILNLKAFPQIAEQFNFRKSLATEHQFFNKPVQSLKLDYKIEN